MSKCRRASVIDKLRSFWKRLRTALSQYNTQRLWLHSRHAVLCRLKPWGWFSTISRQIVKWEWHVVVDSTNKELWRPWQPHCILKQSSQCVIQINSACAMCSAALLNSQCQHVLFCKAQSWVCCAYVQVKNVWNMIYNFSLFLSRVSARAIIHHLLFLSHC